MRPPLHSRQVENPSRVCTLNGPLPARKVSQREAGEGSEQGAPERPAVLRLRETPQRPNTSFALLSFSPLPPNVGCSWFLLLTTQRILSETPGREIAHHLETCDRAACYPKKGLLPPKTLRVGKRLKVTADLVEVSWGDLRQTEHEQ